MALSALILVLLRGAHLAALAALFGTLVSLMLVAPAGLREAGGGAAAMAQRALLHLAARSAALALLTCVAWTALEATAIAGAASVAGAAAALGTVLGDTRFGHLALVRLALLGIAAILVWRLAARGPAGAGGASCSPP